MIAFCGVSGNRPAGTEKQTPDAGIRKTIAFVKDIP